MANTEVPHEWVGLLKSLILLSRNKPLEIPGVGTARIWKKKRGVGFTLSIDIDNLEEDIEKAAIDECC